MFLRRAEKANQNSEIQNEGNPFMRYIAPKEVRLNIILAFVKTEGTIRLKDSNDSHRENNPIVFSLLEN